MSDPEAERVVVLVCGPPGAGKTTYAKTLDLVIYDRDDPQWANEAQFTRAIAQLKQDPYARAVVIRSGARSTSRKQTATRIGATEVKVLAVDPDTCIRRVRERNRPYPSIPRQIAAVREWWRKHEADAGYSPDVERARRIKRYGPEFIQARAEWQIVVSAGHARCAEPVCLCPTRAIDPDEPWDLCHDPSGETIIGPGHRRCNRSEAAQRGNRARAGRQEPRVWLL